MLVVFQQIIELKAKNASLEERLINLQQVNYDLKKTIGIHVNIDLTHHPPRIILIFILFMPVLK